MKGPPGGMNSDWNAPEGSEASPVSHHLFLLSSLKPSHKECFNPYLIRHVGGEHSTDLEE